MRAITEVSDEFLEIFRKTNRKSPSKEDIRTLKIALEQSPDLWRYVGDLSHFSYEALIKEYQQSPFVEESLRIAKSKLQDILSNGTEPAPLEWLLIDQVIMSWLRHYLNEAQYAVALSKNPTLELVQFWEKRLSASQRRYLRACETLARVGRLIRKTPALQINIATESGQQVNIAGDFRNAASE